MSPAPNGLRHPADGELVRLVDGELAPPEAAAMREHLARCGECADRHRRIVARTKRLGALLDRSDADLAGPPVRRRRAWPRAAAAAGLLLAGGLLAPPIRAWVVERVEAVAARLGAEGDPAGGAAPEPGTTAVRFPTAGSTLVVRVRRPAPGAALVVRRADPSSEPGGAGPDEAVLELRGPRADVMVLPDGVRLEGGRPGVRYPLRVPSGVGQVEVRVGGLIRVVELPTAGTTAGSAVEIPLDGSVAP